MIIKFKIKKEKENKKLKIYHFFNHILDILFFKLEQRLFKIITLPKINYNMVACERMFQVSETVRNAL